MMSDGNQDPFKSVGRKPGLQIWTINNMQMVHATYCIKGSGQSADIHYWIGNSSSQDEQGAAAIYVTQLDEFLGGSPVQHREVQGSESPRFRSYFKNGLIYKKGGVASGFHHVDTNAYNILRLLHVKGRKHVTATEVEVSWNSFNNGDIFLLDMGRAIVQWNGPKSNTREKLKAVLLAQDIRDRERGGRTQIGVVEGGDERDSPELMKVMAAVLGQRTGPLKEAVADDKPDKVQNTNVRLYHVFDNSGNLVVQEVATQPLTQDLLHSSDCYIVDQSGSSVMVWKGKQASKEERHEALNRALGYIKAKNYPSSTTVEVMSEGGESAMFKYLFKSWSDKGQTQGLGTTYSMGKIAKVDQVKFDVMELQARPELAAQQRMVDDASGEVKVWRIENLELAEVNPSTYGQFYGGDCYLVLYTYRRSNQQQYILYMWQVSIITNTFNLSLSINSLSVFLSNCSMTSVVNPDPDPGARLFQLRGTNELNTKATEMQARASSLNTNDVFLLRTDHLCYLWYGKVGRVMGRAVSDVLSKQDKQVVMEGQEPAEFWVALGGKAPYASDKRLQKEEPPHSPRLFECSNQTGQFRMTEVDDFAQSDLDEEDVMLLDTWEEIFLWVGNSANQHETKEAWTCAQEYLRTHPAGRDPDTPVICVKQGSEPSTFTGWYNAWDPHKWSVSSPVSLRQSSLSSTMSPSPSLFPSSPAGGNVSPSAGGSGTFLNPELLIDKSPSELPHGVDPGQREVGARFCQVQPNPMQWLFL
uniref:Villin like n=1 Tax=Scophthalmus maximus TaxID=52904 RepID=A0A8D3BUS1_SCOMX